MAIVRTEKTDNYVRLDKGFLNDPNLSWQAKGMLAYMLSLPDDWQFNMKDLQKRSRNGRDAAYSIMNELIAAGYVKRIENRKSGKFGHVEYIVRESIEIPFPENPDAVEPYPENPYPENQDAVQMPENQGEEHPHMEEPYPEKPYTENPYPGKPDPENPTLLKNKETNNPNELKNNGTNISANESENEPNVWSKFYECFGRFPSGIQQQEILDFLDKDGFEPKAICYAFELAFQRAQGFHYARAILTRWFKKGIRTYEAAVNESQQYARQYERRRGEKHAKNPRYHQQDYSWLKLQL